MFTLAVRVETETAVRIGRLEKRERDRFGNRIDAGGDMFERHKKFMAWAASYDDGGLDMRSRSEHDKWQAQLQCPLLVLDGSLPVEKNFEVIRQNL